MKIDLSRRKLLVGLGGLIAAPAVVKCASLMPVRGVVMDTSFDRLWALLPVANEIYIDWDAVVRMAFDLHGVVPREFTYSERSKCLISLQ